MNKTVKSKMIYLAIVGGYRFYSILHLLKITLIISALKDPIRAMRVLCSASKIRRLFSYLFVIDTTSAELCLPYAKWLQSLLRYRLEKHGFSKTFYISLCNISAGRQLLDIFKRYEKEIFLDCSCTESLIKKGLAPNFIHDTNKDKFTHAETYQWVLNASLKQVQDKPYILDFIKWYSSPPPHTNYKDHRLMAEQYRQLESLINPCYPTLQIQRNPNKSEIRVGLFRYNYAPHGEVDLLEGLLAKMPSNIQFIFLGFGEAPARTGENTSYSKFTNMEVETVVKEARSLNLDIAIFSPPIWGSLCSHMTRVIEARIAPTQVYYLGDITTSGLKNLDYFVFPDDLDLKHHQVGFTETLLPVKWGHAPTPPFFADMATANMDAVDGEITYVTNSHIGKLNDVLISCWVSILRQVPNSRIILCPYPTPGHKTLAPFLLRILKKKCKEQKVDPARFVIMEAVGSQAVRAILARGQVYLDTFPYTGSFSLAEAIRAGLPSVCLVGDQYYSQLCKMQASIANLNNELLVYDKDAYINRAVELGLHQNLRKGISQRIQKHLALMSKEVMNREFSISFWKEILRVSMRNPVESPSCIA